MSKPKRTPSFQSAMKRLEGITVNEINGLKTQDLHRIGKLQSLINTTAKMIQDRKESFDRV